MVATVEAHPRQSGENDGDKRQKTDVTYRINFNRGASDIRNVSDDNLDQLLQLESDLIQVLNTPGFTLDSVIVMATSSPEGSWESNAGLSRSRGESVASHIKAVLNSLREDYSGVRFIVNSVPENWEELDRRMVSDNNVTKAEREAYFSHAGIKDKDERERVMRGESYYGYLLEHVYPMLRVVELSFRGHGTQAPQIEVQRDTVFVYVRDTVHITKTVTVPAPPVQDKKTKSAAKPEPDEKLLIAFRTNFVAVPLLNVGMEIPLGNSWSVSADVYYPWLKREPTHKDCFQLWAADVDCRYWFRGLRDRNPYHRLRGSSVGVYAAFGYYDFEKDWSGYRGEFYNVGVDYMYAIPAFHGRARFEFEIGIGYIYSPATVYDCFESGDKLYARRGTMHYTRWFGPTRAQISIVVPIFVKTKGSWMF